MYLELSAMVLFEHHLALERSEVRGVAFGHRASRRGDLGADLGRSEDLHPATRGEKDTRRLVRPVQSQPKA